MKVNCWLLPACAAMLLTLIAGGCGGDRGARMELRRAFVEAHEGGNADALMQLYYLDGVRESDQLLLKMAATQEVVLPLLSVAFEPLSGANPYESGNSSTSMEPSLPISWLMVVSYNTPERLTAAYPVGMASGRAWLAAPRPRNATG